MFSFFKQFLVFASVPLVVVVIVCWLFNAISTAIAVVIVGVGGLHISCLLGFDVSVS